MEEELLLDIAVNRKKSEIFHIFPQNRTEKLPKTLQTILSKHPFPLSQGPVVLTTDCLTTEKYENNPFLCKSISEVLTDKTVFYHNESQDCYEWHPLSRGVSAWEGAKYEVKPVVGPVLCGPASTMRMGIVYTCNLSRCLVFCPCTICTDDRKTCQRSCKNEICSDCNAQCIDHVIKVARLFSPATDHYMMVTEMMTKYRHAYPFAGIPLNCMSCTRDVQEHQQLHMVWHARCRFCKFQMRPFQHKSIVDIEDYKTAEKNLKILDARTCSFCLRESQDSYARKKHEDTVHNKKTGKFKCDQCVRSFSNMNALSYHTAQHDELKVVCDLCGFQSSSSSNLVKHKLVHSSEKHENTKHFCKVCKMNFSNQNNLNRHQKETHYKSNTNLDFVEDIDESKVTKCEYCDEKFKRISNLKRHEESQHSSNTKSYDCPSCEKSFSRKDNLSRHVKKVH